MDSENRQFDDWRQLLTEQAIQWQDASAKDKPDLLLRGTSLDKALLYLRERSDDLNALERGFIVASQSAREPAEADQHARDRRQLVRTRLVASVLALRR